MGFGASIKSAFSQYAVFRGRATRSEFWWFYLFLVIVGFVISFIDNMFGWKYGTSTFTFTADGQTSIIPGLGGIGVLTTIWSLATILPFISVAVRRLHDIDRTGWWLWIYFICCIGWIVLLVFFVTGGTPGENRYGPPRF